MEVDALVETHAPKLPVRAMRAGGWGGVAIAAATNPRAS
jgi:hypothetical protein